MDTIRNRSAIFAQVLRAATSTLRRVDRRIDDGAALERVNALDSIDVVADELEAIVAGRDLPPQQRARRFKPLPARTDR